MNLILENNKQISYFTNMANVLAAMHIKASSYDWYVSDIDTSCGDAFSTADRWIDGEELESFLEKNKEVQFNWAIFSAVAKGCRFGVAVPPTADGNGNYWQDAVIPPQLNGALFEIVCWDSSATIFVGIPEKIEKALRTSYPAIQALHK